MQTFPVLRSRSTVRSRPAPGAPYATFSSPERPKLQRRFSTHCGHSSLAEQGTRAPILGVVMLALRSKVFRPRQVTRGFRTIDGPKIQARQHSIAQEHESAA